MSADWLAAQLSLQSPLFWLGVSLGLGLLLVVVASRLPKVWRRYAILARWVFIPYFGLLAGGLSPRLMGLTGIDWLISLGFGLGLIAVVLSILFAIQATVQPFDDEDVENQRPMPGLFSVLLFSGAEQFHWAFLRGAIWEILLFMPAEPEVPAYTAIWLAALLSILESLVLTRNAMQRIFTLVIITTTSILFFYTTSFWLCWILHAGAMLITRPAWADDKLFIKPQQ